MKQPEYIEGPKARGNFERGMIALFKVPEGKERGRETHRPEEEKTQQGPEGDCRFPRALGAPSKLSLGGFFCRSPRPQSEKNPADSRQPCCYDRDLRYHGNCTPCILRIEEMLSWFSILLSSMCTPLANLRPKKRSKSSLSGSSKG